MVFIDTSGTSVEPTPNLNLLRTKDPLRESHDDEGDVVYISSTGGSRTDQTDPEAEDDSETDDNANPRVINPVQLHLSYEDSQDVEIYHIEDNKRRKDIAQLHLSYEDSQDVEIYHIEDNRVRKWGGPKKNSISYNNIAKSFIVFEYLALHTYILLSIDSNVFCKSQKF